jgi:hypothetical protein
MTWNDKINQNDPSPCEVVQKIKNNSNHLRVWKKYLEEYRRLEAIAKQKKPRAETGRKYYHGVTARRRRNDKKIKKDFLNLLGSDRKCMLVAKKKNQVPLRSDYWCWYLYCFWLCFACSVSPASLARIRGQVKSFLLEQTWSEAGGFSPGF